MKKRRKGRESEEVTKKVIANLGQHKGYKTIPKGINIPVFGVANIMKDFKAFGTVANIPGHGYKRKNYPILKKRIVQMVGKEHRKTLRQNQADL